MVDIIAAHVGTAVEDRQRVLETLPPNERLTVLLGLLAQQVQVLELSQKIESEVQGEIDRGQREMYLRERLRAIKRELGEEEDDAEIEALGRRISEAAMPDDVRKIATQELERLSRMSPAAAEYHVLRTYIDWILDMPWGVYTEDNLNLKIAAELLDKDHYDLEKVKKRIIEYLAVRKLKPDKRGPILCFIGPPRGREDVFGSLHRRRPRTKVRASVARRSARRGGGSGSSSYLCGRHARPHSPKHQTGRIDEPGVHAGRDRQDRPGLPGATLLPPCSRCLIRSKTTRSRTTISKVAFDLSRVLFIATGNTPEGIPAVLRDRMEVLELPGYTAEEKVEIAQRYLVPRQLDDHGLTAEQLSFASDAIGAIVRDYTEEAGVRGLEREIAAICRAHARLVAERIDDPDAAPRRHSM